MRPKGSSGQLERRWRRWLLTGSGLLFLLLSATALLWLHGSRDQAPSAPQAAFPLPPVPPSPFRNTGPEAHYVGSKTCYSCHELRTASFRQTGMGVSMAEVDPAQEPADATFDHAKSKHRYQVLRKEGQLWHRELLLTDGPEEIVLSEYPLKYVVGSGRHARTYLVEAEGFLVESPVTWYTSRKAWDMSPGYDRADHMMFERGVGENCLICHAGHAEAVGQSQHRIHVKEAAISCERCHGPGSLHQEYHATHKRGAKDQAQDIDFTIVNPHHLQRELAEAVCQQCHLSSAATVPVRGRKPLDYRPGLPLQAFRQDNRLEGGSSPMKVVGHVEQMHLSRCYKGSQTLTCTTCHNPHAFPRPEKRVAYYRALCLDCHPPERCTVEPKRRLHESPDNNCVKCHMPSSETDVAHVAFTHHRIGVHATLPEDKPEQVRPGSAVETLQPFLDYPPLGDIDRKRLAGLAYLHISRNEKHSGRAAAFQSQAFNLLSAVYTDGLRDPVLEASLARLHFERGQDEALPLAEGALSYPDFSAADRCAALFVLAAERHKRKQFKDARTVFRELVTLRRHPHDWQLLADCENALGNRAAAVEALEMAVRINPRIGQIHRHLAQHYRQLGDPRRAAWHEQRAAP